MPNTLGQFIDEIESINSKFDMQAQEEKFLEDLDENGRDNFNALQIAFKDMEARFNNAVDYLVPESKINNANITNSIKWINNGMQLPNNYNSYVSTSEFSKGFAFLANLAATMPLPVAESSERLKEAARSLALSVGQYQGRYERNIEELEIKKEQLDGMIHELEEKENFIQREWQELEKNINEKNHSLDQQYSQLHSDFINNQSDRATTFENLIQELKEEKTTVSTQIKEEFQEEKASYIKSVKEEQETLLEEWNSHFQEWYKNSKDEFDDWKLDLNNETNEIISNLREKQNEVSNIVGNVANNGIAGHFAKEAEEKKKSAKIWRISTIIAFLITILVGFLLLILPFGADNGSMNIIQLVSRLVVTAALGSLTAYLSKLASNDEKSRKYNSSMEIRLRTLNPYLDAFDNEEQISLKKELFPVIFREREENYQNNNLKDEKEK